LHVRHYQGHWYKNQNLLTTVGEKPAPIAPSNAQQIRTQITQTPDLERLYRLYPGNNGLDWITPVERPSKYHHAVSQSRQNDANNGFGRYVCSPEEAQKQEDRIALRFREWWSHSACPDQVWMESFPDLMRQASITPEEGKPLVVLDIGCNKGYTSADFMDLLTPHDGFNPRTLHQAIQAVAKERNTKYERDCGVCGDCTRPVNTDHKKTENVQVHCFEPSPATYEMLTNVKSRLARPNARGEWIIHNKGLHNHSGILAWHTACKDAVGNELCKIVPEGTPGSIKVPVITVDEFASKELTQQPLIHMLKVDAEGLDPAVLKGAEKILKAKKAVMVMFEFNPGLRDKKPPYGMWGTEKGFTKLLDVTSWLDTLSYDCYLDSRVDGPKGVNAPPLYRITGECIRTDPRIMGWSNVICASRAFPSVAQALLDLSPMVGQDGTWGAAAA